MYALNNAPNAPAPVGMYSQAVDAGQLVFLSGQIGIDPHSSKLVSSDASEQTKQILKNIEAVLKYAGSHWDKVVMTTIFLADMQDGPVVNELYSEAVNRNAPPARQTVAVRELPMNAKVEISVVALKG